MYTKVRNLDDFTGTAALYRLADGSYVVASATIAPYSGPETLVFPASKDGTVTSWNEIGGFRGTLDHDAALATLESER